MKLLRVGPAGAERPALLDRDGVLRDLSALVADVDGELLADASALDRVRAAAADAGVLPPLDGGGCAWARRSAASGRSCASGSSYHDHAREAGAEPPAERRWSS